MYKSTRVYGFTALVFILTFFLFNVSALTDGYIICGTFSGKTTVLLDKDGKTVKTWNHTSLNGYSCYLLPNGNLLWSGQANGASPPNASPKNGIIEEVDSSGKTVWTYTLANDSMILHHDMKPMPNGHILATSFHYVAKATAVAAGLESSLMGAMDKGILCEKLVEIDPKAAKGKEIVWEWRLVDHIVAQAQAASHPEKFGGGMVSSLWYGQWMHLNGLDYNPDKDLIVFSARLLSECYVIDHSTSTAEAKGSAGGKYGKGGDLLYRWGNPKNYGASGATTLDCLHSTTWIPKGYPGEGDIMFFHNNQQGPNKNEQSQVVEIKPSVDAEGKFIYESGKPFDPVQPTWRYAPSSDFYSRFMSSAMRMPNGHTIAHETYPSKDIPADGTLLNTNSRFREVDNTGNVVWIDTFAGGNVSKIMYYPSNYIGICKLLNLSNCQSGVENHAGPAKPFFSSPSIRRIAGWIDFSNVAGCEIGFFNLQGKKLLSIHPSAATYAVNSGLVPQGTFCVKVTSKSKVTALRIINVLQ
jgi:hypothetical protein